MKTTFILFFISITWHAWAQKIEIYKPQQPVSTGAAATGTANTNLQTTVMVSSPRLTQPPATRRANAVVVQPKVAKRVDPPRVYRAEKNDGDSPERRDLYCHVLNATATQKRFYISYNNSDWQTRDIKPDSTLSLYTPTHIYLKI